MGASKDKQRRKEMRNSGFDLESKKELDAEQSRKKQTRVVVLLIIAFAVVGAIVFVLNSNLLYRNMTALVVDGERFSITETNFFLRMADGDMDEAIDLAARSTLLRNRALEEGITLTAEDREHADLTLQQIAEQVEMFRGQPGAPSTVSGFIVAHYGRGMNQRILRQRVEFDLLGMRYVEQFMESTQDSFTEEELEDFYQLHRADYDRIHYRVFEVPLDTGGLDPNMLEELDISEGEDLGFGLAELNVEIIASLAEEGGEQGFITGVQTQLEEWQAQDADRMTWRNVTRNEVVFNEYGTWLLDDARTPGDVEIWTGEESFFVLYFVGEDDNDYYRANVRHILIMPDESVFFDEDGDFLDLDEEEIETLETTMFDTARTRAEEILEMWEAAGTEERFIELVREYSDDYTEGDSDPGLYDELNRQTSFVPEFLDWAMDESRSPGDVEIVETMHGFHIMYFVGHSDRTHRHSLASWDMAEEAYTEWIEAAVETVSSRTTFWARLAD